MAKKIMEIKNLEVRSSSHQVLHSVNFDISGKKILSIIGPQGSGKSTLLRCLNRLIEERVGYKVSGQVIFDGKNIYDRSIDLLNLRRQVSMVFSQPVVFDHLSVFENITLGLRFVRENTGILINETVEKILSRLGLWDELKDQLHKSPQKLSVEYKQFICLARSLILKPKLVLMDEPTTRLDVQFTLLFEQIIKEFSRKTTVVMSTSSRKQAARISNSTAFLLNGELIEIGRTSDLFMNPQDNRTEDFLTGRFG